MKLFQMNNHKLTSLLLGGIIVMAVTSCKVTDLQPEQFEKPNSFGPETTVPKTAIDTLKQLPLIQDFYKDPLLKSLIAEAVQNNFDIRQAMQRLQESNASLFFYKRGLLPEVQAQARAGQRRFGTYTIDGVGNFDTQFSTNLTPEQRLPLPNIPDYYLGLSTQWEADVWGKLRNLKRGALQQYLSAAHTRDAIQIQMIAEIARHYYHLIILDYELEILEENKKIRENALEAVRIQKEHGRSNELGIELIQAQLHQVNAIYQEVKLELLQIENKINFLCGRFPQKIERSNLIENDLFLNRLDYIIPSFVLQNRPDIKASEFELKATNAHVKAARAAFFPSFQLTASMGLHSFRSQFLLDTPTSLANELFANLTMPLLNRRTLKAQLMETKAKQQSAYIQYQQTVVGAFTEVYELLQKEKILRELQKERKSQIDVLLKSIQTSQLLFVNGRSSFLEVVTAQENYLLAQIEWLRALTQVTHTHIDLYKAIGGGLQ